MNRLAAALLLLLAACGDDAPVSPDARPAESAIQHVVLIVQENHTFDNYFGDWCTAPAGSAPTCTDGPACCEAMPAMDPSGAAPIVLDDDANAAYDPDHTQSCEITEMNGGAMDRYATGAACSDPRNVARSPAGVVARYRAWAEQYALADRFFQPIIGQSFSNNMYLAEAKRVFTDNEVAPDGVGANCELPTDHTTFTGVTTTVDLLLAAGYTFKSYAQGYADMVAHPDCPDAPDDCPAGLPITPCSLNPADTPWQYYAQFQDNPAYITDYDDFADDLAHGHLPSVAFVKPVGYKSEHPGLGTTITDGVAQVEAMVDAILASPYAETTLILVFWDEGGGYYDHVTPPPTSAVDDEAYGTRVPLLAIGKFARAGTVSHVVLEHSSIVKFLEWNFLGGETGQLGARDAEVANLGSLLDPAQTGMAVPED